MPLKAGRAGRADRYKRGIKAKRPQKIKPSKGMAASRVQRAKKPASWEASIPKIYGW